MFHVLKSLMGLLLKLIGTASERLNMTVLFALAYLIDEKNNHLIVSTNGKQILMILFQYL